MNPSTLYSIGHGQKTPEEFISELQFFRIQYLIDVRTSPFSKWASHFNQGIIEHLLNSYNIKYVYMGDKIGGRPLNDECYDDEGFFDYEKMAQTQEFKEGLLRLVKANANGNFVAIMCSESDPTQCHRSKLIGRELYFNHNIDMQHIISSNRAKSETQILIELTKGDWRPEGNIFGICEPPYFKSRKAYKKEEIEENELELCYD